MDSRDGTKTTDVDVGIRLLKESCEKESGKLKHIFREARLEIYQLLGGSFARFKITQLYEESAV